MIQFSKALMLVVALTLHAAPHKGLSQCTDSLTASQVNRYLAKGAEARELLLIAQQQARLDSAEIAIRTRQVLQTREELGKEQRKVKRWRWVSSPT